MWYVQGTLDYKIEYLAATLSLLPSLFVAFTNADHGDNPNKGCSTTGSVLMVGAMSKMSRLQSIVALSMTKAEFVTTRQEKSCAGYNFFWQILACHSQHHSSLK